MHACITHLDFHLMRMHARSQMHTCITHLDFYLMRMHAYPPRMRPRAENHLAKNHFEMYAYACRKSSSYEPIRRKSFILLVCDCMQKILYQKTTFWRPRIHAENHLHIRLFSYPCNVSMAPHTKELRTSAASRLRGCARKPGFAGQLGCGSSVVHDSTEKTNEI